MKKLSLILFVLYLVLGPLNLAHPEAAPGQPAPNIKLADLERNAFELAALKGKKIILTFWASWSESSLLELIFLQKNQAFLKNKNFEIVTVNLDQRPAAAKFFAERRQIDFPVLLDMKLDSLEKYRLLVIPTTFIIDQDSKIKQILVNFDENVARQLNRLAVY